MASSNQRLPSRRPNLPTRLTNEKRFNEKRFNWMLDKDAEDKIKDEKDAADFISFIVNRGDKMETLSHLTTSEFGLKVLKEALATENCPQFVQQYVIPLINFVAKDNKFAVGTSKRKLALV